MRALGIAVLATGAGGILFLLQPWATGVELSYQLPSPGAADQTARVLERRARALGAEAAAFAVADDRVVLRVREKGEPTPSRIASRIVRPVDLKIYLLAPPDVQAEYGRTDSVPPTISPGFRPWPVSLTVQKEPAVSELLLGEEIGRGIVSVETTGPRSLRLTLSRPLTALGEAAVVWNGKVAALFPVVPGRTIDVIGPRCATEAKDWRMGFLGGALLDPFPKPSWGRYRGRLR